MARFASLLIAAAIAVAVAYLPGPRASELAARTVGDLLVEVPFEVQAAWPEFVAGKAGQAPASPNSADAEQSDDASAAESDTADLETVAGLLTRKSQRELAQIGRAALNKLPPEQVQAWVDLDKEKDTGPPTLAQMILADAHVRQDDEDPNSLRFALFGTSFGAEIDEAEQAEAAERQAQAQLEAEVDSSEPDADAVDTGADEDLEADPSAVLHFTARQSVVRGLRQQTTQLLGKTLIVPGSKMPQVGGAGFESAYLSKHLMLAYTPGQGPHLTAGAPYSPPGKSSLLPPFVAILLAVLLRRPIVSLLAGILVGAYALQRIGGTEIVASITQGSLDIGRTYFWRELVAPERAMIVGFVICMLAMVGIITKNGGIRGIMDRLARLANSAKNTQIATFLMGLVIFFDDYANTILVGSTMRPLSDRYRVSREKLAYLVDSTAAPVAGISIFSTWIAFMVSTYAAQLPEAGLTAGDGYEIFLQTLPYRFYCGFALVFVALVCFTGRDFGPMRTAELRARKTGQLVRKGSTPLVGKAGTDLEPAPNAVPRAWRALLPILAFIGVTLEEILRGGGGFAMDSAELFSLQGMTTVLSKGSGSWPLLAGSSAGMLLAFLISAAQGLAKTVLQSAWRTLLSMGVAIGILYGAWMIGAVCSDLGTASYLSELIGDMQPALLPLALFFLAGLVAFSTGSSWSTMSILLPLVIGLAYQLGEEGEIGGIFLLVLSISAVLEGAIFGDHCSPISDTTVMSSIASASDHIDHVKTQIPYAVSVMLVATMAGYFPCAFLGASPWLCWLVGIALLCLLIAMRGKPMDAGIDDETDSSQVSLESQAATS